MVMVIVRLRIIWWSSISFRCAPGGLHVHTHRYTYMHKYVCDSPDPSWSGSGIFM